MNITDLKPVKKRITISVVSQIISQVFIGMLGVLVLKIMTNNLGTQSYGVYATILAFVSTFALLTDLGLNTITSREIAKQPENANEIISHNMGLRLFLCAVMIPVISAIGLLVYPHASNDLRLGILFMSCYLFFDSVWSTSGAYFGAKVRSDITATIVVVQQLLFFLCVLGVAIIGWGLFGFLIANVLTTAIGAISALWLVRKHIKVWPRVNLRLWRKYIGMSVALGILSIINVVYVKADSVMISIIEGTTAVGLYGVAYALINFFLYIPGYLMGALTPSMATAKGSELNQIVQKAFHFVVVFACLLVVGGFIVRHDIVILVSSRGFTSASAPFAILALATAFSYVNSVFGYASIAINKHYKIVYISISALVLNICINLVLIPRYGIAGAAWATTLSELVVMLIGYRLFRKQTGISLNLVIIVRPIIAALIALILGLLSQRYIVTNSVLFSCLIDGTIVGVPYFILLYIMNALPSEMKFIFDKSLYLLSGRKL
jgi:O-antigen/teichoic acid export membrane protein